MDEGGIIETQHIVWMPAKEDNDDVTLTTEEGVLIT